LQARVDVKLRSERRRDLGVAIQHPCIQEDNPHVFVEVQFYVELEPIKVSKLEASKDHTQTRPKILRYTTPLTSQERR
jgi:hypothetical protein